ncbi:4-azaleucine resistance probable transporter AzlC [Peribacillus simplex]|uniref:4-azaleucine resistance probable transporter AzlC n=1 Tax=Peribacillus simplex TaxID=1478 RepID=A0A9X8RBD0_9BACI|nr:AzlC family ABC transporter permease [Peribacillus simplex]SIR74416.1 4-azaleucine resistance probable transporter AzlC [Peribacillus simplex]
MSQDSAEWKSDGFSEVNDGEGFWEGVKDCIPTLLGYLSIGFAAGVVEKTSGLSMIEVALMSLLLYAGSGQFIAAGMIAASHPVSAIIFTIFFVNSRHLLLSAALAPYFRQQSLKQNLITGSLLTDETFGVAVTMAQKRKQLDYKWMLGLNLAAYLNWFIANMAGGFFGQWIPDPEKYGMDFALPAMFIGLLVLQILSKKDIFIDLAVAFSSILIVVAASFFFPGSTGVIVATVVASTIGMVIGRWK